MRIFNKEHKYRRVHVGDLQSHVPFEIKHTMDMYYVYLEPAWYEDMKKLYDEHLKLFWAEKYKPESNDCDDFAFRYYNFHRSYSVHQKYGASPAIGVVGYKKDSGVRHVLNYRIDLVDGVPDFRFVEPQPPPDITTLSLQEIDTINLSII